MNEEMRALLKKAQKSIDHALEFLNAVKDYLSEYSREKEMK